jgi:hypothetical protein
MVRIDYDITTDRQYLVMFHEDQRDKSRHFFGGAGVDVPKGEKPPESVKHSITTIQMIELLDAILAIGCRPTSNAWSAGHVSDLKAHIAFAEGVAMKMISKGAA